MQAMKKLKVLACAFSCHPPGTPGFSGGEDVLGWNLLSEIALNHQVWALTHARNRAVLEQVVQEESNSNLHFYYVGLPAWLRPLLRIQGGHQLYYYLWQIKALFAARKLQRQIDFDLFHHITYANDWMVSFIGAFSTIPYVRGPGGGAHRTPKGFDEEYPLGGRLWERVRSLGQWLFRHDPLFVMGQHRARAILVCNQESLENVPAKWSRKVHLFPVSGVSSNNLTMVKSDEADDGHFRVLSAGSLIRVKGFGLAIKAFGEFAARHPNTSFSIVGTGPEESRLRSLVHELRLENKVHLLPSVPQYQLLSMMASHDVFLFPSLRDGGGTVVVESMSVGTPVICLDNGGPGLHVNDECGVKITPRSPRQATLELADALERLYLDEPLRLKLGRAARERMSQSYSWDKLGQRLMEIYGSVLANAGSR